VINDRLADELERIGVEGRAASWPVRSLIESTGSGAHLANRYEVAATTDEVCCKLVEILWIVLPEGATQKFAGPIKWSSRPFRRHRCSINQPAFATEIDHGGYQH
jgi:hypothetical protein